MHFLQLFNFINMELISNNNQTTLSVLTQPYYLNKKIVVTGASSGIGRSLSYWFLNNGAKVVLFGRDIESLKEIGHRYPT